MDCYCFSYIEEDNSCKECACGAGIWHGDDIIKPHTCSKYCYSKHIEVKCGNKFEYLMFKNLKEKK